nr:transferrin-binding protein-like solute binding protein [Alphaproteobacteria bacterium]
ATLTVDRKASFGFDSNYMAYIGWNLERTVGSANRLAALGKGKDRSYDITGNMIAGIETDNINMPSNGDVTFIGKGRGYYSHVSASQKSYATIFDVETAVDFFAQTVEVNSTNTMRCGDKTDMSSCATAKNSLDFSTQETFIYITNNKVGFRGDVSLIADSSFTGTIDARFYGGRAQELGSIFAMRDETGGYYYGAFGGEREGVESPSVFNTTIGNETVTVAEETEIDTAIGENDASYTSLTAVSDAAGETVFTVKGLSAYKNDTTDYIRAPNRDWDKADKAQVIGLTRISGSAASLTFDEGNISAVTAYTDVGKVAATADRSKEFFGFVSHYMAYVSWNNEREYSDLNGNSPLLTDTTYTHTGVMLAGVETADEDIASTNTVPFEGKGRGTYNSGSATENDETIFDILATVDFSAKNVTISSSNTCKAIADADCGDNGADRLDSLNITSEILSFVGGNGAVNNMSGNVTTEDANNNTVLSGTLDARFYGDTGGELGGVFALVGNDDSYYYGVFGGLRSGSVGPIQLTDAIDTALSVTLPDGVTAPKIPDDTSSNPYESLTAIATDATDSSKINVVMNGLSVYQDDTTLYNRGNTSKTWAQADRAQTIKIARLAGAAASLTFGSDNNIDVTLYTDDADINDDATITVDRSDMFGFASNDMAYISWNLTKSASTLNDESAVSTDNVFDIKGDMIAGIKTENGNILRFGATKFTGEGRGTYGVIANNVLTSYETIFEVTASVNFVDRDVTISSSQVCEVVAAADCGIARSVSLEFTTDAIAYTGNSISGDVALIENNQFSGTLDARFYGYIGREFGGTFALTNSSSYYYGAFGANRETLLNIALDSLNIAAPLSATIPNGVASAVASDSDDNEYASLFNAITDENGDDRTFTMNALAVSAIDITDYVRAPSQDWDASDRDKDVTLAMIENSLASLTINGSGQLSVASIYLNDNISYTANASSLNKTTLSGNINNFSDFTTDTQIIDISRDVDLFGFESTDMVYIDWEITEALPMAGTKTNQEQRHGMMIAGIESDFANIPTVTEVDFTGKGRGYYENIATDTGFDITFDITASVNFATDRVTISSDNTCEVVVNAACGVGGANRKAGLDFTTEEITYYINEISGDATADGIGADNLTGKLDARFYGDGGHKLGGIFALNNGGGNLDSSEYYYGAFGTQRINPITQFNFNKILASESGPKTTIDFLINNQTDHASLYAVAIADGSNSFTINGLAVYQSNHIDYARVPNKNWGDASTDTDQEITIGRLGDSGATIIFDEDGDISGIATYLSINPYIATNIYTATVTSPASSSDVVAQNIDEDSTPDDATSGVMNLHRGESFFGFNSYYMSYIDWQVTRKFADLGDGTIDRSYDYSGAMLAGIKTDTIPPAGTFDFTGKGRGSYGSFDADNILTSYDTVFDVTANVDFASKTLVISSDGTCRADDCQNQPLSNLDFTTPTDALNKLSFADGDDAVNNISASITVNALSGTLDARFYGGAAQELGGTFALTGTNNSYYYGAFGTQRIDHASLADVATIHADTPVETNDPDTTGINKNDLTGFNDASRAGTTGNALPTTSTVLLTQYNDKKITTEKITGAVAEFDFAAIDIYGKIKFNRLKFYFSDKKYNLDPPFYWQYDYEAVGEVGNVTADNGAIPDELRIIRKDLTDYMALVSWKLNKNTYDAYGYTITGWETEGSDIPTTGIVNFTGKGEGHYYSASDDDATYFDVILTVNFNNNNVSLISTNTCNNAIANDCKQAINQRPHLDFTGILSYSAGMNEITGDVATVGDGYTNLTGTAD